MKRPWFNLIVAGSVGVGLYVLYLWWQTKQQSSTSFNFDPISLPKGDGVHLMGTDVESRATIRWFGLMMSFRSAFLVTLVLPVAWVWTMVVDHWPSRFDGVTRYQTCGYDLRATPDRCPECGAVPSKPA